MILLQHNLQRDLQCDLQNNLEHDLHILTHALQLQLLHLALKYQRMWCCRQCHHQEFLTIHSHHDPGKSYHRRLTAEIVNITSHLDNEILVLMRYHTIRT